MSSDKLGFFLVFLWYFCVLKVMLFLVTKKENIKCTNCPISTHLAKKVTCACHACLCFSYCLYIHSSSLFRFHAKFFFFFPGQYRKMQLSQARSIWFCWQSKVDSMEWSWWSFKGWLKCLLFTLQFMRLLLFIERIGGKLLYVVLRPFFPNLIFLILSMLPKILYM